MEQGFTAYGNVGELAAQVYANTYRDNLKCMLVTSTRELRVSTYNSIRGILSEGKHDKDILKANTQELQLKDGGKLDLCDVEAKCSFKNLLAYKRVFVDYHCLSNVRFLELHWSVMCQCESLIIFQVIDADKSKNANRFHYPAVSRASRIGKKVDSCLKLTIVLLVLAFVVLWTTYSLIKYSK
jgi:hypothetical protein